MENHFCAQIKEKDCLGTKRSCMDAVSLVEIDSFTGMKSLICHFGLINTVC